MEPKQKSRHEPDSPRLSMRRIALYALIASLVVSGALGIAALLMETFGKLQAKVLLTSLTVSAASILALASATALERERYAPLARAGIAVTALAAVLMLTFFWFEIDDWAFMRVAASAGTAAVALAHCSLLSLATLERRYVWVRTTAFALAALLAVALVVLYWTEYGEDWYARFLGIVSICVTVFTILVPVAHKMSDMRGRAMRLVPHKVNLDGVFDALPGPWQPTVVAHLASGHVVRAARGEGSFPRHRHRNQDEFFLVMRGALRIRFDDRVETLLPGEGLLVPAGVYHQPEADEGTALLLFEPASTKPTGN